MKKYLYLPILLLVSLVFSSCKEELWEPDELTLTPVWSATITSSDTEAYYIYPDQGFFIHEYNVDLDKHYMYDAQYDVATASKMITFKASIKENDKTTEKKFTFEFDSSSKWGKLTIEYIDGSSPSEVKSVSNLEKSDEYIDVQK